MRVHHVNCGAMRPWGGVLMDGVTPGLGASLLACRCLVLEGDDGLILVDTGVVGQDVLGRWFEPVRAFRLAGVLGALATLVLTLLSSGLAVAHAVELAFAVAASTFCPLLLLGIWWRGLTAAGARASPRVMTHATATSDALTPFVVEHAAMRGAYVRLPDTLRAVPRDPEGRLRRR